MSKKIKFLTIYFKNGKVLDLEEQMLYSHFREMILNAIENKDKKTNHIIINNYLFNLDDVLYIKII